MINCWCHNRGLKPANGQSASELSARTLHYYRSSGLLDAPDSGAGYGQRHFLQLASIRILQAQGLPLSRIHELLFGRPDQELKQIADSAGKIDSRKIDVHRQPFLSQERWTSYPLNEQLFLVARDTAALPASQLEAIRKICNARWKQSSKAR